MPFQSCHFPRNSKYSVLMIYAKASQSFLFCGPILKKGFSIAAPLMDCLDVNDTFKRQITNLKIHFCQWRNPTMHTIQESNCTVLKLPGNGNSKAKNN